MTYLLDTHVILWWLTEPNLLPTKVKNLIIDRTNKIQISSVSLWEIAIKQERKNLNVPTNLIEVLKKQDFKFLNLSPEESLTITNLPKIHSDPFDRLLIAQAKYNNLIFITKDKYIRKYPINTYWN